MHKDKQSNMDADGRTEGRNKTKARSAVSRQRPSGSLGSEEIFAAVGHTTPQRLRGRSLRRHPRFYRATVTSAKGREMEPRDKSETSITPRDATCYDEWIECSRGGKARGN